MENKLLRSVLLSLLLLSASPFLVPLRRSFSSRLHMKQVKDVKKTISSAAIPLLNENIQADKVRLILPSSSSNNSSNNTKESLSSNNSSGYCIVNLSEALQKARELEMDLMLVSADADPPVCKIVDYGKYKYKQDLKAKKNYKKTIRVDLKEIKLSQTIEEHDYGVRVKAAKKFLGDNDRVKVAVVFKGREMQYQHLGNELLDRFLRNLTDIFIMEQPPRMEGRQLTVTLSPKKKGLKANASLES